MTDLLAKTCKPAEGSALKGEELRKLFGQLQFGWTMPNEHHLEKEYRFKDFREALDFVNRLGEIAEREGHHPDVFLTWGRVKVTLWTHSVGGLSENDFILAAKADPPAIQSWLVIASPPSPAVSAAAREPRSAAST
jgi:4a-hydroxytetrahydrobiopterin dehydratase